MKNEKWKMENEKTSESLPGCLVIDRRRILAYILPRRNVVTGGR
jgi:hypothetical protein